MSKCLTDAYAEAHIFRTDDAFNAMRALRQHPKINRDNMFLVGASQGGSVGLLVTTDRRAPSQPFRAIVAFYPGCDPLYTIAKLQSPVTVFAAGKDDWVPASLCTYAKSKRDPGADFELVVYPDAFHGFDMRFQKPNRFKGRTAAYDARATADSQKKMKEFLIKHLTDDAEQRCKAVPPESENHAVWTREAAASVSQVRLCSGACRYRHWHDR